MPDLRTGSLQRRAVIRRNRSSIGYRHDARLVAIARFCALAYSGSARNCFNIVRAYPITARAW
jgi:hypothetical protein